MGFYFDQLSEAERKRFGEAMSQETLKKLDEAVECYGASLIRESLLPNVPGNERERGFWRQESYNALKEFARILLNLSDAIAKVRESQGLAPETPYYEQGEDE